MLTIRLSWRRIVVIIGIALVGMVVLGLALADSGGDDTESDRYSGAGEPEGYRSARVSNVPPALEHTTLTGGESAQFAQQLIVRTGELSMKVDDVDDSLTAIAAIAARYGGYVQSSETRRSGDRDTATIIITVEAAQFDAAMVDLRAASEEVERTVVTGEDVSPEYVDLESQLRNLEATRDRILSFLDETQNVSEAILVSDRLTEIEGEIEIVKGRMEYLSERAALSTISIYLFEETASSDDSNNSLSEMINSAVDSQGDLVQFLIRAVVWSLIVLGPYLLVVGLFALGWRRWGRRPGAARQPLPTSSSPAGDGNGAS